MQINDKIVQLQKDKSFILSQINRIHRNGAQNSSYNLEYLKNILDNIKVKLKQEFNTAINKYWNQKISNIPINDPANMFPQVNQIFRPKEASSIPSIKIAQNRQNLLAESSIDTTKLDKDEDGIFIISNNQEKLNVIGTHLDKTTILDGINLAE